MYFFHTGLQVAYSHASEIIMLVWPHRYHDNREYISNSAKAEAVSSNLTKPSAFQIVKVPADRNRSFLFLITLVGRIT